MSAPPPPLVLPPSVIRAQANARKMNAESVTDFTKPMFGDAISGWKRHLAIFPVRSFDGRVAWLRFVERRRIQKKAHLDRGPDHWWQYRWNF